MLRKIKVIGSRQVKSDCDLKSSECQRTLTLIFVDGTRIPAFGITLSDRKVVPSIRFGKGSRRFSGGDDGCY
jgi:hypothetical protein